MTAVTLELSALHQLATEILVSHDTSEANAEQVAAALVAAEADGQNGHGASRIPSYAAQSRSGKVDGHATPKLKKVAPAALRVDARSGFAAPRVEGPGSHVTPPIPSRTVARALGRLDATARRLDNATGRVPLA